MTLSRVVVLPRNVMRLTKVLLAFLEPHRHVDFGVRTSSRTRAIRPGGIFRSRRERRHRRKLHVAAGPIHFLNLVDAVDEPLLAVELAGCHLEEWSQRRAAQHRIPIEGHIADAVTGAFINRDSQLESGASCHRSIDSGFSVRADRPVRRCSRCCDSVPALFRRLPRTWPPDRCRLP